MEAFVAAVLLRTPGIDSFRGDAQPNPPHRKSAQTGQAVAGERRAVVRAE
jgi:hypothetical protein